MVRVTLTREPPRNEGLLKALSATFDVAEVPLTSTVLTGLDDIGRAIDDITLSPRVLVVSSARSAPATALAAKRFPRATVLAVGDATARALHGEGLADVVVSPGDGVRDLTALITEGPVVSIGALAPRAELAELLATREIEHLHVVAYETRGRTLQPHEQQRLRNSDVVVVSAPSAWRVAAPFVVDGTLVVAAGETTADAVRADHARVAIGTSAEEIATLATT